MSNIKEIMDRYSGKASSNNEVSVSWEGFKEFTLIDKVKECDDIISFYFRPNDNTNLIKHIPGQFLPMKINTEDPKYKDEIRTYSLSMLPNNYVYRISVKRIEGGLISTYLHDTLKVGDTIKAMQPTGVFTLDKKQSNAPIVLLAGGIGITPLLSMLYDVAGYGREVYFVQAVQNSKMQPFNHDINEISKTNNVKNIVFYDRPLETDVLGEDYNFTGFITKDWIKENLPLNAEFYFCGPPPFMKNLNKSLLALGVSRDKINFEFFGEPQSME